MKRNLHIPLPIRIAIGILGIVTLALLWLVWTPGGARVMLGIVSALSPVTIESAEVSGRLADDLRLEGLHVRWAGGEAQVDDLQLSWRPLRLLRGHLDIDRLIISSARVVLEDRERVIEEREPAPPDIAFPKIEGLVSRLEGDVRDFHLTGLTLYRGAEEPLIVEEIAAHVSWRDETLSLSDVRAALPGMKMTGRAAADFSAPALDLQLTAAFDEAAAQIDGFSLSLDLAPAPGPRRLAGPIQMTATLAEEPRLQSAGHLDWSSESFQLQEFSLTRLGASDEIRGEAEVKVNQQWHFHLRLTVADLDLEPETGTATNFSGRLELSGNSRDFKGLVALRNDMPGWQGFRLAAPVSGHSRALRLSDLEGNWLNGRIEGDLLLTAEEVLAMEVALSGSRLDPAVITPEWPGRINFQLQGAARRVEGEPVAAEVSGTLLDSTLRGQSLKGEVDVQLAEGDLHVRDLLLQGEGFDITAKGQLRERIDFSVEIARLGALVPGAAGQVSANGWGRWLDGYPSGSVIARGREISINDLQAARLELVAEHPAAGEPFLVRGTVRDMSYAQFQLSAVDLNISGTLDDHAGHLAVNWPEGQAQAEVNGQYGAGVWKGRLMTLAGRDNRFGPWQMEEAADLLFAPDRLRSSPIVLTSGQGERLHFSADFQRDPWLGHLAAQWEDIQMEHANPWLAGTKIMGRASGHATLHLPAVDRMELYGRIDAAVDIQHQKQSLSVRQLLVDIAWDEALRAQWTIQLTDRGEMTGTVTSTEEARFGLPGSGRADAAWQGLDLDLFSPWIDDIQMRGRSSGHVEGQWLNEQIMALEVRTAVKEGEIQYQQLTWQLPRADAEIDWNDAGIRALWDFRLGESGRISGRFHSSQPPPHLQIPQDGEIDAEWQAIDLALLNPLVEDMNFSGNSSGDVSGHWRQDGQPEFSVQVELSGEIAREEILLPIRQADGSLHWNEEGLLARWDIHLFEQAILTGSVRSDQTDALEIPQQGEFESTWEGLDLVRLRPWLPEAVGLEGLLGGRMEGRWLPGLTFQLSGESQVTGGKIMWIEDGGEIAAPLRAADLQWDWGPEGLSGDVALELVDFGQVRGNFRLPITAELPPSLRPEGPLAVQVNADFREEGLVTAIFPGIVQETRGRIEVDLTVGGTWERPELTGNLQLAEAGGILPTAGIQLRDIELRANLAGEQIQIEHFQVSSGPGRVQGTAAVQLSNWRPVSYQATLQGERFQAVNLPELQILANPNLTAEGTIRKLAVRGEIVLPELLIFGRDTTDVVTRSPDVVVVDDPEPPERIRATELDIRVRIILGDRVLVKAEGVDARLGGEVNIRMSDLDSIIATGEIRVEQGAYSAYGVNLRITRGNILFAGVPVQQPTLDILATRTVGDVRAGVLITGTPQRPVVNLYSDPSMPDTDILAYIVLGHPLGANGQQAGALMLAAGALLTRGESVVLQDRLRRQLGVDVLAIEAGEGEVAESRITIGKYLSPDLYISFGQSLFTNTSEVRLRYSISEKWQVESAVGVESSVDLYYQIEFR